MKWINDIKKSNRKLSDISIEKYIKDYSNFSIACNKKIINTKTWLLKTEKVLKFINSDTKGNKKNRLTCICVILSPDGKDESNPKYKKAYEIYKKELFKVNQEYRNSLETKNIKEDENWVSWETLLEFQKELYKPFIDFKEKSITFQQKIEIQKLLILSLYTLLAPRRLEYALCKIIDFEEYNFYKKKSPALLDNNIYLVKKNKKEKFFSFGYLAIKVKTKINEIINIPDVLNNILNLHLKFHHDKHLLFQLKKKNQSLPMSKVSLSKTLTSINKKKFNKKIGCVMLRKIKITNFYEKNSFVKLAKEMNHSVQTQQLVYNKNKLTISL